MWYLEEEIIISNSFTDSLKDGISLIYVMQI